MLAARPPGRRLALWVGSLIVVAGIATALFASADRELGETTEIAYVSQPLPTTTTTTVAAPSDDHAIDPSTYGTERPPGLIDGTLFDLLTAQGADPQRAVCTGAVLLERISAEELLALGIAEFAPAAVEPVVVAAQDCGIDQQIIDAILEAGL